MVVFVDSRTQSVTELTAMLGLPPDESWEIGTPFRFGGTQKLRDTSSWAIVEWVGQDEDCFSAAERLVTRLRPLIPRFQALPSGVKVSLRILVDEDNGVFGLGLDRPHVQFAAAIGADIDVSVFVHTGPPPVLDEGSVSQETPPKLAHE